MADDSGSEKWEYIRANSGGSAAKMRDYADFSSTDEDEVPF